MTTPDPAALRALAGRLRRVGAAYRDSGARVRAAMSAAADGAAWIGRAAEQAELAQGRRHRDLARVDDLLQDAAGALVGLAGSVEQATALPGSRVFPAETVVLTSGADDRAAQLLHAAGDGLRSLARTAPSQLADGLLGAADARVLAALGLLDRSGLPDPEVLAELSNLAAHGDPVAVRAYLNSLSGAQRDRLVHERPALLGALDGAPPTLRYAANRVVLEQALAAALAAGQSARAGHLRELLADPRRQFLLVDARGDGRVVEVFGDLDAAEHVALFVPGISHTIDDYDDPGSTRDSARTLQEQAVAMGRGSVATIAWLGYDTPDWLGAPFAGPARTAAAALVRAVDDLLLRPGVTATVVAHSYGSVVAGYAVRAGLLVDSVAVLGSPGMGTDRAADLGAAVGMHLYAARAPADPVSYSENFGQDPSDPRFGATRIATGSGPAAPVGHHDYLRRGSESTRNLARITVGDDADVTTQQDDLAQRLARGPSEVDHVITDPVEHLGPEPMRRAEHLLCRLVDPDLAADAGTDAARELADRLRHVPVGAPSW